MTTRRNILRAGVAATVIGTVGCNGLPEESDAETNEPDIFPPEGPEADDPLLAATADPSLQVPPAFFSAYRHQIPAVENGLNSVDTVPRLGGQVLAFIDEQLEAVSIRDCETVTGSIYYSLWSTGPFANPVPSGQTVHVSGTFGADTFIEWLESVEAYRALETDHSAQQFVAETQGGSGFETWGVRDGRIVIISRSDVTSRSERYDEQAAAASEALSLELDQLNRDDAPIARTAPAFATTVRGLDSGPIRMATGYALTPLGADTGTKAVDEAVSGVIGGGMSASSGQSPSVQRVVSYLDSELATESQLMAAYRTADGQTVPAEQWSFSTTDTTVHARVSVAGVPEQRLLKTSLPVSGYEDLSVRITPGDLNRAATPQVSVEGEIVDGYAEFVHNAGDAIEPVELRYVQDGEQRTTEANGQFQQGERLRSDEPVDQDSQALLVWRAGTTDAAALDWIARN